MTIKNRIEEKARQYKYRSSITEQVAFVDGATWMREELTRWRDVKEELPEKGTEFIIRYENFVYKVLGYRMMTGKSP